MNNCLDLGVALFALAAAVFWFLSAYGKLPPMPGMYWTQVPDTHPFYRAIMFSVRMNRNSAGLSGMSALCAGMIWSEDDRITLRLILQKREYIRTRKESPIDQYVPRPPNPEAPACVPMADPSTGEDRAESSDSS